MMRARPKASHFIDGKYVTDEAARRANDTEFGLACGVFITDIQRAQRAVDRLDAGTCWINAYNTMPVEMPLNGTKKSGIGREDSRVAVDHFSQLQSVPVEVGGVVPPYRATTV